MMRLIDEISEYDGGDRGRLLSTGPGGYPVLVLGRNFAYGACSGPIENGPMGDSAHCVIVNMSPGDGSGPGGFFGFSADEAREFACAIITAANNVENLGADWEIDQ